MRFVLFLALASAPLGAQSGGGLPRDLHPDSRSRLTTINQSGGQPEGAAAIRLHRSGVDVRWASPVGRALTELAIISTAREHDQPYEWSLHEMEATAVGLDRAVIDVVRNKKALAGLGDKEAAIIELARALSAHNVSSETYARA